MAYNEYFYFRTRQKASNNIYMAYKGISTAMLLILAERFE